MRRREFIALLGGAAAWPIAARAQQGGRLRRIGMLETVPAAANAANFDAFRRGLRELGYVEGQNVTIEYRSADGRAERFPALAAELVRLPVDVIVTRGTPAALAAKQATATIPVVMAAIGEPLGVGVVASLAHPGGNVTGFTDYDGPLAGKWLEMLTQVTPKPSRVLVVYNPATAPFAPLMLRTIEAAGHALDVTVEPVPVHDTASIAALALRKDGGLLVLPDFFTMSNRALLLAAINEARVPAVFWSRTFVDEGGLMSYSTDSAEQLRRAASYIDRILKGARAADLPVQNPTTFELAINLKTAKAIGVTLPPSLLATANEVIE
jgi:putative tryptophan/tyrosine transport system substrate-binding protein